MWVCKGAFQRVMIQEAAKIGKNTRGDGLMKEKLSLPPRQCS